MSTLGLALSGGGFRATLFRPGVVRLLGDAAVDTTTASSEFVIHIVSALAPFKRRLIRQPMGLDAFACFFAAIGPIHRDLPPFTHFFGLTWVGYLAMAGA